MEQELGAEVLAEFEQQLIARDCNPQDYVLMPVHPWQWQNKLTSIFAADIANQRLVFWGRAKMLIRHSNLFVLSLIAATRSDIT